MQTVQSCAPVCRTPGALRTHPSFQRVPCRGTNSSLPMLQHLLLGTLGGVYGLKSGAPRLVGLPGSMITHLAVSASGGTAVAAVPKLGPVHRMYQGHEASASQDSGLHLLHLPSSGSGSGSGSGSSTAEGTRQAEECTVHKIWSGDARSCWVDDVAAGGSHSSLAAAVGTEPADVFCSLDGGATWSAGTSGFAAAPSRQQWSFPAPPHEPHVLSIERLPDPTLADQQAQQQQAEPQLLRLVAGIEVGGVLVSADGKGDGFTSWQELNQGLYPDVHSCRIDPHDPYHWLAVTGRGLYSTHNAGASWQPQSPATWSKRYTVGLAFNPQRKGEVLVAAGDRPPAIGVHVFRSTDGGDSWQDITEAAFSGSCAEAKGTRTPVPYFYDGQALLGTDTGHLLASTDADRQLWRPACRLPHPILCMAAPGQSPSSVMH